MSDAKVTVLGVRHHGPGSARMVLRALARLSPDAVLIEGPPDASNVMSLASHQEMKPPVALLLYEPDQPDNSVYYPFAEFSPEWQALRWAFKEKTKVRFMDLPQSLRTKHKDREVESAPRDIEPQLERDGNGLSPQVAPRRDPLDALAIAAGFSDGESWWSIFVEEHRGDDDPVSLFDAIREAMASARNDLGVHRLDPEEPAREAFMRKTIRESIKEGCRNVAVVCGAWHAPVLAAEALNATTAKADDDILKGRTKRKIEATWIPWTYDRISVSSGYGAGVKSPGWYDHLWLHHEKTSERWLTKVARLMRDEDLDASPASVIESVRLAESLAALRGRALAGLDELGDATLAVLCHGQHLPMRVIERKLIIGTCLGEVPEGVPTVPLQRDLTALQKSLRLKVSADDAVLDLDQRKELDLARSRLLHRLNILRIQWGQLQENQQQRASTFHEIWKLQWRPEFAVALMEAARWGNTVAEASAAFVSDQAEKSTQLSELTSLLHAVMLADLPNAIERLIARIQNLSAVMADIGHLLEALPPLARVLRYSNVRKADAVVVQPVVAGLLARACAGLVPACASLDDDAATIMVGRIDSVHAALSNLNDPDLQNAWQEELRNLGDAGVHGLVSGRVWRHLLDVGHATPEEAATRLSLALSRGNDPAKAASWLEGFLGGSGMVLVHDDRLLSIVDHWVCNLTRETFEQVCPIARRTFSTFQKPERRQIGEKLARSSSPDVQAASASEDDYEADRGALVESILRLILGDLP